MLNYFKLYNHHIPQRALSVKTPIPALEELQKKRPELFGKRVYNRARLDSCKTILSDGNIRMGTLDTLGVARLSELSAGVSAKIQYDYKTMKANSIVSTELHDDVHEFWNWKLGKTQHEGKA